MKFENNSSAQPVIQREMPFFIRLDAAKYAQASIVESFDTYRDAVLWCWENRPHRGKNEPQDQSLFASNYGVHAPHMSRFVSRFSKAPMDLHPDLIQAFEGYTGWRAITQYIARKSQVTLMEEVIEQRKSA